MEVGVNLLNFGGWVEDPDRLARWTAVVEALGYHFVMISDHVAVTPDVATRYPAPFYDPFVTLSWLAGRTRIGLGTTVTIVPYRHPLLLARMAANLDRLSGGRFILGVGVGWAEQEFAALGLPFRQRGAMTDEYLDAIRVLWTNDVASFHGRWVHFDEVDTRPRPVQLPHPPIWVGGASDAALRRTVRVGDAWHPVRPRLDWLTGTGLPRLRELSEEAGRPVPALAPRLKLVLTDGPWPGDPAARLAGQGSLRQIRDDLRHLAELGATHVVLDSYVDDPAQPTDHEAAWRALAILAEQALGLGAPTVR